jgi:hypothetical protein
MTRVGITTRSSESRDPVPFFVKEVLEFVESLFDDGAKYNGGSWSEMTSGKMMWNRSLQNTAMTKLEC